MHKVICLLALLAIGSCSSQPTVAEQGQQVGSERETAMATDSLTEEGAFDFDQMFQAIREKGEVLLVYGDQEPLYANKYREMGSEIAKGFRRVKVQLKGSSELQAGDLENYPLFLLGSPESNSAIGALLEGSPIALLDSGFRFYGRTYAEGSDAFALGMYPNPQDPSLPMSVFSGNNDRKLIELLTHLYGNNWRRAMWGSWGYQVFRGKKRMVLGAFAKKPDGSLAVSRNLHWDFESSTAQIDETEHFRLIKHGAVDLERANEHALACESNFIQLRQWLGNSSPLSKKIEYHLYASSEEKGLLIENTQQSHIDVDDWQVHTVLGPVFANNRIGTENRLLLRELLGKPQHLFFEEGLAAHFAPSWQLYGTAYWMARLVDGGQPFSLEGFFDAEIYAKSSPLVRVAAASTLVSFLIEKWGDREFVSRYASWSPGKEEVKSLAKEWDSYIWTLPAKHPIKPMPSAREPSYFRGFNFAHEGYRIYNGYGSTLARKSLDFLKGLKCNAVAIVPYSYMGDPNSPTRLNFNEWAGGENDESVARTAYDAKSRQMQSLLKPQIWFGRGAWPGDVKMDSDKDWQLFFYYYGEWIRHYAMLAAIHEMDALCLGVEFAQATLIRPDEWRQLANDLRKIYPGKLTYAANWGAEAEQLSFWDAFDYIGVNCYYPLSQGANPDDRMLKAGFDSTLVKLQGILAPLNKPVLFTEIGFRSVEEAWKNPHAGVDGRGYNEEVQARCYQVVCDALLEANWCKGVFWWKWPSYMDYARQNPTSFSPTGKPAEKVVGQWFEKME